MNKESREELVCKLTSKQKLRTAIDIQDMRREVEIMHHLPHTNIVTLKDIYEDNNVVSTRAGNSLIASSSKNTTPNVSQLLSPTHREGEAGGEVDKDNIRHRRLAQARKKKGQRE
ncbi:hypothetical protein Fmac_007459 [Flemingia macrophylla]|uniref:Protein kinase domain-containing protein n=1 Tax=Flemingia macrophylla TaxID=520843 RepID=A0ABD1MUP6_9FABA